KFRTDLQYLTSQETLRNFLSLKEQGATFGAMSDSEWAIVERAALNLGQQENGTSILSEREFKDRVNELQKGMMKVFIRNNMTPEQYVATGLKNETNINRIREVYNTINNS